MKKIKFEDLDRPAQRVAIAQDVINQLDAHKLVARRGAYLKDRRGSSLRVESSGKKHVKNLLPSTCHVCALGGMLCSVARNTPLTVHKIFPENYGRFGKYSASDTREFTFDQDQCINALVDYFTDKELREIEQKFEGWDNYLPEIKDANTRLRVVMQSIIDNEGGVISGQH